MRARQAAMLSILGFAVLAAPGCTAEPEQVPAIYQAQQKTVATADARIAYVEAGDPAGVPVIFLHGIPTSSYLWRNVMPGVAGPGRRLIAIDLVGFGDSDGRGYGVLDQVTHLERFVDALGLDDVIFVTHDWGAGIALLYATRHPGKVRGFATMEGALPPVYPRPDIESFGPAAPLFARMRSPSTARQAIVEENVWIEKIVPGGVQQPLTPEELAAYRAPFAQPVSRQALLDMTQSLPIAGEPADVVEAFDGAASWWRRTEIPKLVLYATPGRLQPQAMATWAEANLKNVTTVSLGPGIHFIQEDNPEGVARALDDWLDRLPRPAAAGLTNGRQRAGATDPKR